MKSARLICGATSVLLLALAIPLRLAAQQQESESATPSRGNPVPFINQPLVPDVAKPGAAGFTLTVNGTGFVSSSVVKWSGSARVTKFVNSSRLTASVLSTDIVKAGTASIRVFNPSPGGGTSKPAFFTVTSPTPGISLNISPYGTGSGSQSVAVGDFKGDGKLDLAVANLYSNTVSVLVGNGDGTFQPKVDYATGLSPTSVTVGDFNDDGKLDLAVATAGGPSVGILLGNGNGTFQAPVEYLTGSGPDAVAVGDFNGDGKLDLVTVNDTGDANGSVSVLLGYGDGTFQPHMDYATGDAPFAVGVGDFNGDDRLDLAVVNYNSGTVSILLGNGDGTFKPHVDYATPPQPIAVAVADFNGDGRLDLAVADFYNGTVGVFLGKGDGTFEPRVDYAAGAFQSVPYSVMAGDFNGDGKLDLALTDDLAKTVSVLLGNGDGTFQSHVDYAAGSNPQSLAVGDFNGDGRLDLAVANYSSSGNGTVSILLQSTTVSLSTTSLSFADQVIDTSSVAQSVKVTNTGNLTLKIAGIGITGANATDFSQTQTCGSSLAVGASCAVNVTFKPTAIGPRTALVTITGNGVRSPSFALRGTGVVTGSNATLSPKSLSFGPQPQILGTTSSAQSVQLNNYGTGTLNLASITTSGDFSQTHTCASSLAAGAGCTISVTFKPTQRGARTGTLSATDNAPGSPQKVSLSGTGTAVELNPTSLNFGGVIVGQTNNLQTTLTNVGSTTLSINSITITGMDSDEFSQSNTCDSSVGAGKSCTITVTFKPFEEGVDSADISISDNGGGSPQQVPLSGYGENPSPMCRTRGESCCISTGCAKCCPGLVCRFLGVGPPPGAFACEYY